MVTFIASAGFGPKVFSFIVDFFLGGSVNGSLSRWLLPQSLDKLQHQGSSCNNSLSTRQKISSNNIFQNGTLSAALTKGLEYYNILSTFQLR